MKSVLLPLAALIALVALPIQTIATAADLDAYSPADSTIIEVGPALKPGFYVGGEAGGGFGKSRKDFSPQGSTTNDFSTNGTIAGVTAGYNWNFGRILAGVEGDVSLNRVTGRTDCPNKLFNCETDGHFLVTGRGRLGYSFNSFMPYVTGGLAAGTVRVVSGLKSNGQGGVNISEFQQGWTIGAGLEAPLAKDLSVKFEYLYVRLDNASVLSNTGTPTSTEFIENVARIGVNYHFH